MFKVDDWRNLVILALLVVVLVLGGLILWGKKPPADDTSLPSEDDVVDVIVGDQQLPGLEGFKDTLRGLGIVHMALVDNTAKLHAITIDGTYIDLCESGTAGKTGGRTCRLEIHSRELMQELSGASNFLSDCGRCKDALNYQRICHSKGEYKNMYRCHNDDKDAGDHHDCRDDC